MKKTRITEIMLVLSLVLTMTGCCLKHNWQAATCENPATCAECGKTDGQPLGHVWTDATCTDPETCSVCDEIKGTPLGHSWVEATCTAAKTCSICSETEGTPLEHTPKEWKAKGNKMVTTCSACGNSVEEPVDWETIGRQAIVGRWKVSGMLESPGGEWLTVTDNDVWIELKENGTGKLRLLNLTETGYLKYDHYHDDFIYFEFIVDDGTYTFVLYYDMLYYKYDTLFINGNSLELAFERG